MILKTKNIFVLMLAFTLFMSNPFLLSREKPTSAEINFYKGISYYLLEDIDNARFYTNKYLERIGKEDLKRAFNYLFKNDKLSASRIFENYIRKRYKRLDAVIGYALSIGEYSFYYEEYYFSLANDIFPRKSISYLTYGYFYLKEGDLASAKELIKKAIRIYDLPEYHLVYSLYLRFSGNYAAELKELQKYINKTNYKKGYIRGGNILIRQSKYDQALKFLEPSPDSDEKFILKAKILRLKSDYKEALSVLKEVKERETFSYKKELGINYFLSGKTSKAIKIFKKIELLAEEDPEFFYYYGKALLNKNKALAGMWLYRAAVMSDMGKDELQQTPKGSELLLKVKERKILNFFRIDGFKWIGEKRIIIWGKRKANSYKNFLYVFNRNGNLEKSYILDEVVQDIKLSPNGNFVAIVSFSKRKDVANFYLLSLRRKTLRKINSYKVEEKVWIPLFSNDSKSIYFVSEDYTKSAFKAPFSIEDRMGKMYYFYPDIILEGYYYNIQAQVFTSINRRNINKQIKLFKDIDEISSLYSSSVKFKELIEKGKAISFSSSSRMEILRNNLNTIIFEATETDSFLYHIFKDDGTVLVGESNKILRNKSYEYCEPIYFNPDNNLFFIKGEGKIFVIDTIKKKLKKIIKKVNSVKLYKSKRIFYLNKDLRVYSLDTERVKVKKALKMKGYDQILTNNQYIYFVNKGLWLYSEGAKRENFSGLFPKVEKYNISPYGSVLAFSKGGKLILLSLK